MPIVEVHDVTKKYKDFTAVDQLSLSIEKGSIYGLLGPNGAGKSTTMNMICNNILPTSGKIFLFGEETPKNFNKVRHRLGLVPQKIALYLNLSAYENIEFFAKLQGLRGNKLKEAVEEAIEFAGLETFQHKKAKEYSGGMQRRLNIACGVVHRPELVIMDEPTVGIDPQSRNHILESIKKLNAEGTTVIYCSHYMEEVDVLCDHIGIIDHGKLLMAGTREEIKEKAKLKKVIKITIDGVEDIKDKLGSMDGIECIEQKENQLIVTCSLKSNPLNDLITRIDQLGFRVLDVEQNKADLEDIFLTLTGRELRD